MHVPISSAAEVTPHWLTMLFRDRGLIGPGMAVRAVSHDQGAGTFATTVWHLHLEYEGDTPRGAPRRLFLKVTWPAETPSEFAAREHAFYTVIAPAMAGSPGAAVIIPCYDVVHDPNSGAAHLLLADLSETHETRTAHGGETGELAVEALARFHAAWWDSPRLGVDIGRYPSLQERISDVENARIATATFFDRCGDSLPDRWRATYERVLDAMPGLYTRHATGCNLTLAHGDAHLGNFLFPRRQRSAGSPASRPAHVAGPPSGALLLDWQFWHPTIGGTDLAFLIARWEPETRRALEAPLLHRYYAALLAHGVTGYTWDDCYDDYRLSVILVALFIPVWQCTLWGWEADLRAVETVMTAHEELGCEEMLGRAQ